VCLLLYYFWVILSLLLHLLYIINRVLVSVIAWPSHIWRRVTVYVVLYAFILCVILVFNTPVVCVALRRTCSESICPGVSVCTGCTSPALTPYRGKSVAFSLWAGRHSLSLVLFFCITCMRKFAVCAVNGLIHCALLSYGSYNRGAA